MSHPTPLKFLMPGWFALVMGLCGLALAWHRAQFVLGDMAAGVALMVGGLAAVVFVVLVGASLLRASRHADALAEDLRHPVRHAFVAAVPVSLLLLATVGVRLSEMKQLPQQLEQVRLWNGNELPKGLRARVGRDWREREQISERIAQLEKQLGALEGRLANAGFVERAPAEARTLSQSVYPPTPLPPPAQTSASDFPTGGPEILAVRGVGYRMELGGP